jgi:adenylate cyclase class 2
MAIEIELKAWVDDLEKTKSRISSFARYTSRFDKQDTYWYSGNGAVPSFKIRVRKETDDGVLHIWVTYKTKEMRNLIEVNNESEFSISEEKPFEELLAIFGLQVGICKHKTGWAWSYNENDEWEMPPITIELAEIETLGWFVELEILTESNEERIITAARNRLLDCLKKIGIGEDRIETRYYTEMLRESFSKPD